MSYDLTQFYRMYPQLQTAGYIAAAQDCYKQATHDQRLQIQKFIIEHAYPMQIYNLVQSWKMKYDK